MKVAIQGIAGSFHDQAASKLLSQTAIELVPCASFAEVFNAVETGQADRGVCAIENNIHGPLNAVYRLLDRHNLWIAGETSLHISQYLITSGPTCLNALNTPRVHILSQAPALAQCELWLDKHLPQAKRQETHDTADSVRLVTRQKSPHYAAIAGKHAAELYGGTIISGPINDDTRNYTRFVLLSKDKKTSPQSNRTSIILTTDHKPGALYTALGIFAKANINLSKLDSHPIVDDRRHYAFYIDLDAGQQSPLMLRTFHALSKAGFTIKILGSYFAK